MCKLSQPDMSATMAPGNMVPQADQGIASTSGIAPMMQPGPMKEKPTKFAKLMQVVLPVAAGAGIGGFGGNWRVPGSGNEAASNFFTRQNELALQKLEIQSRLRQQSAEEAFRQSEEKRNEFYDQYLLSRARKLDEPTQEKEPAIHVQQLAGYPGVGLTTTGPDAGKTFRLSRPAGVTEEGYSDLSNTSKYGDVPLGPSEPEIEKEQKLEEPQPQVVTDTDERGVSTTRFVDKNPKSKTFGQTMSPAGGGSPVVATKHPKPEKPQKLSVSQRVQSYAEYALEKAGNDPKRATQIVQGLQSLSPELKSLVVAQLNKTSKGKLSPDVLKKLAAGAPQEVPTNP